MGIVVQGDIWYDTHMPSLEPTDILILIISLAIGIVSVIMTWAGILIIRTLRNIQYISRKARKEGDKLIDDVDAMRTKIKNEGKTFLHSFSSLGMLFSRGKKKK